MEQMDFKPRMKDWELWVMDIKSEVRYRMTRWYVLGEVNHDEVDGMKDEANSRGAGEA